VQHNEHKKMKIKQMAYTIIDRPVIGDKLYQQNHDANTLRWQF